MNATTDSARKMITEDIPVAGNELLARVKALLAEGRVRHIKVMSPSGEVYFEIPLAVGVLGGAALAWASPFLAMAGALAGLVTSVKLQVVRDADAADALEAGMHAAAGKAKQIAGEAKEVATKARRAVVRAGGKAATAAKRAAAKPAAKAPAKRAAAKPAARTAAKAAARKPATRSSGARPAKAKSRSR